MFIPSISIVTHPARGASDVTVLAVPQHSQSTSVVDWQDVQTSALAVATKNNTIAIVQRETKIFFVFIFALILFNYVESFFLQYSRGRGSL